MAEYPDDPVLERIHNKQRTAYARTRISACRTFWLAFHGEAAALLNVPRMGLQYRSHSYAVDDVCINVPLRNIRRKRDRGGKWKPNMALRGHGRVRLIGVGATHQGPTTLFTLVRKVVIEPW